MFLNYCTSACRIIVFLTIIYLAGYIIVKNEKKIENFVGQIAGNAQDETVRKDTISLAVRNYLDREATVDDYNLYSKVMLSTSDIVSVVDAIKATDEYKTKTQTIKVNDFPKDELLDVTEISHSPLIKDLRAVDFDERMETYRKIIDKYQGTLDRMPTNKELAYYTHRMLTDKKFTVEKLENVLQGSTEHHILEKNQSNVVNGELPGNITDAQLNMDVIRKYASVFKRDPDLNTLEFLKTKYLSYKLDEHKFDRLLILLYNNDYDTVDQEVRVDDNTAIAMLEMQSMKRKAPESGLGTNVFKSDTPTNIYNNPKIINIITPDSKDVDVLVKQLSERNDGTTQTIVNKATMSSNRDSCPDNKGKDTYTDPFYKKLAQDRLKGQCNFSNDGSYKVDKLADFQTSRNREELGFACGRSKYFTNIDNDIVKVGYSHMVNPHPKRNFKTNNVQPSTYSYEPEIGMSLSEVQNTYMNPAITFGI